MRDERRREAIVLAAATRFDGPAFTERHLATALTPHAGVLYLEPPLSAIGAMRRDDLQDARTRPGWVRVSPGLVRVIPAAPPGKDRAGVRVLTDALHRRAARAAIAATSMRVRAVIGFAAHRDAYAGLGGRDDTLRVAWVLDDLVAAADLSGLEPERLLTGRRRMLEQADLVVAATPVLAEELADEGYDVTLVPNGADVERLATARTAPRPADVDEGVRYAGFVGQLTDRVDIDLLSAVADSVPLLLVGPMGRTTDRRRWQPLLARQHVRWVGPVAYERLPGYLGAMSVGLVPYTLSRFNRASFPLKLVEYLAAGLPVVSTDLPAARWLGTDLVRVGGTREAFAGAVHELDGAPRDQLRASALAVAAAHSWDQRIDTFLRALTSAETGRPRTPR